MERLANAFAVLELDVDDSQVQSGSDASAVTASTSSAGFISMPV